MPIRITATELAKGLSDVLNRVRYRGETFVVERNGEAIATVGPPSPTLGISLHEIVARLGDIELPGDGFADDLEAAKAEQSPLGTSPWDR